ncbi:MAG: ABC transporter substrate-binding protein [Clostridiales bacterium]|nr:ABC transporter substrate-binding protein [Clostridiales bacterium]
MRRLLAMLLAVLLCLTLFAACTKKGDPQTPPDGDQETPPPAEPVTVRIGGMTGPTGMGFAGLYKNAQENPEAYPYEFQIVATADELTPNLATGSLDVAAVPANLASVLYNNSEGEYRLLAVNTLGVLSIVDLNVGIETLEDLKGKTLYSAGKGSVPEYALSYILAQNGFEEGDVTIEWKSEAGEIVALLNGSGEGVAMLPQPYVTVAQNQLADLKIAIDLTEAWDALGVDSRMITGVLIGRKAFVEANPEAIDKLLEDYKASIDYVNAQPAEAAQQIEALNVAKAPIAQKAIPHCNLYFMQGAEMKEAMQGYLQVLLDQNAKAVGGKLPDDAFYYAAN